MLYQFSGTKIDGFKLYGERNSGTNFLNTLVDRNFPELSPRVNDNWEKHNFVNLPFVQPSWLGIFIVRDPFDWLTSFYRNPHQVGSWREQIDFCGFLRHEWSGTFHGRLLKRQDRLNITKRTEILWERNPVTGNRIENVVQLRNLKIESGLKIRNLFDNWLIVRFEDVRKDPEQFVRDVAKRFELKPLDDIDIVNDDRSNTFLSRPNQFINAGRSAAKQEFTSADRDFVVNWLDWDQETYLGYEY